MECVAVSDVAVRYSIDTVLGIVTDTKKGKNVGGPAGGNRGRVPRQMNRGLRRNIRLRVSVSGYSTLICRSRLVWSLANGRWPRPGFVIDHKNDDPMDDAARNLQEITQSDNLKKRKKKCAVLCHSN